MKPSNNSNSTYVVSNQTITSHLTDKKVPLTETTEKHINENSSQEPLFDIQTNSGDNISRVLISGSETIIAENYLNVFYDKDDVLSLIYRKKPGETDLPFEFSFWSGISKIKILKSNTPIKNKIQLTRFASANDKVKFFLQNANQINIKSLIDDFYTIVFAILQKNHYSGQDTTELMKKVDELYESILANTKNNE